MTDPTILYGEELNNDVSAIFCPEVEDYLIRNINTVLHPPTRPW